MSESITKNVTVRGVGKDSQAVADNGKPVLRKAGKREGQIKLSEDFDAPMEDFKDYT